MKNKILFVLIFFTIYSYSCTCLDKLSVKESIKESNYVFVAKVISKRIINYKDSIAISHFKIKDFIAFRDFFAVGSYKNEYTLEVKFFFKGKIKTKTFKIITGIGGGDCGFNFELGKEYIIYAFNMKRPNFFKKEDRKFIYTNICTRTKLYNIREEREIIKYKKKKRCAFR